MKTVARLLGGDEHAENRMMEVYEFERKLAKVTETFRFYECHFDHEYDILVAPSS